MIRQPAEHSELILRYLKEKYPGRYDELTIQELELQPYCKRVWLWWKAIAEYKTEPNWYKSLDEAGDAPEGTWITVMSDVQENYERRCGRWVKTQEVSEESCKAIYGD